MQLMLLKCLDLQMKDAIKMHFIIIKLVCVYLITMVSLIA